MNDNFVIEYGWMSTELHLKNGVRHLYALIYGFTKAGKECFCSYKTLMQKLQINSRSTVSRYIQILKERGLIFVEKALGGCNHYKANLEMLKSQKADNRKSADFSEEVVHFSDWGCPVSGQYSIPYNFSVDDDSIPLSLAVPEDGEKMDTAKLEKIALQISADALKEKFDASLIENLIFWIADAESIQVKKQTIPADAVKAAFAKLDMAHVQFAIEQVQKHSKAISDTRAYYLAALYNAADVNLNPAPAKKEKKHLFRKKKEVIAPETADAEMEQFLHPYAACETEASVKEKLRNAGIYALHEQISEETRVFDSYDAALADEIQAVLAWAWTVKKKISVNSVRMESELVRKELSKLNLWKILFVMDSLRKTNSEPKNRRAYILTALYNAPVQFLTAEFDVNAAYPLTTTDETDSAIQPIAQRKEEAETMTETIDETEKAPVPEEQEPVKTDAQDVDAKDVLTSMKIVSYLIFHGTVSITELARELQVPLDAVQSAAKCGRFSIASEYAMLV